MFHTTAANHTSLDWLGYFIFFFFPLHVYIYTILAFRTRKNTTKVHLQRWVGAVQLGPNDSADLIETSPQA